LRNFSKKSDFLGSTFSVFGHVWARFFDKSDFSKKSDLLSTFWVVWKLPLSGTRLLFVVSGLKGRHLNKFNVHQCVHRVAEFIENFGPLRQLPAFQALEAEIKSLLSDWC
jgi:hypothetical protein